MRSWPRLGEERIDREYGSCDINNDLSDSAKLIVDESCRAALAALSQRATFPADIVAAKQHIQRAMLAARLCDRENAKSADCDLMAGQDVDDFIMAEHDRDKVA